MFACYGDKPSVSLINVFLENGADLNHKDEDGVGVIHIAAIKGPQ
jgi:hypothetical protein